MKPREKLLVYPGIAAVALALIYGSYLLYSEWTEYLGLGDFERRVERLEDRLDRLEALCDKKLGPTIRLGE